MLHKERLLAVFLLILAAFMIVDATFPVGCMQACTSLDTASTVIHDTESAIGAVILAAATILLMRKRPHWVNTLFLCAQLICGLIAVSGVATHQILVIVEFTYESVTLIWIAWATRQFAPIITLNSRVQNIVRQTTGITTMLAGILTIIVALPHHHALNIVSGLMNNAGQPWLVQHGLVVGVLLQYVSRHVRKGQRRAAIVLAVILATQILHYALFQPRPILLFISMFLLVILWWGRSAFNRNTGPLPLAARLQDIAYVFAGVLIAFGIVVGVVTATHKQQRFYHAIGHTYRRDERVPGRFGHPLLVASETLGVTLLAILLWSLFRPSRALLPLTEDDYTRAQHLLERHSNSSEDYFKLWPQDKRYFFNARRTGFVAYKTAGSVAFALADPIAPNNQRRQLVEEFTAFCHGHGWTACFLLIQDSSKELYKSRLRTLSIGSSAVIDVQTFATKTMREKWWRWQYNRAQKVGFAYDVSLPPHDRSVLDQAKAVSDAWLERAGHSEQGFALGYFDEDYLQNCRLHLLRDAAGQLVAFSNELPVFGKVTQRTVDLIRFLPDIDGAMPVLVMHLITRLAQAGNVKTFDLGFVPLAKVDSTVATLARRLTQSRFSAAGLEQFKGKFRPEWQTNYIAYDGERTDLVDLAIILAKVDNVLSVDPSPRRPDQN
jgi:phosphatidylglycerol lysyltransferase